MVHLVQFGGHRIQLGLDHGAGFVDKVDGLVRQETVADIAVGQRRRRDQRAVLDLDAVEHLVPLFQAAQDGDGVLHRRLIDHDGLEAALEGGVFLDIFAVFVQRGGADAVQLAAGQHGFEQVAGVHGAVGLARADDGVQLVNKEDDLALALFDFVEHALQALLKLAAVLGACHHGVDVEFDQTLVA